MKQNITYFKVDPSSNMARYYWDNVRQRKVFKIFARNFLSEYGIYNVSHVTLDKSLAIKPEKMVIFPDVRKQLSDTTTSTGLTPFKKNSAIQKDWSLQIKPYEFDYNLNENINCWFAPYTPDGYGELWDEDSIIYGFIEGVDVQLPDFILKEE